MPCDGPVHLRRATPSDARAIAAVHVQTWQHAYRGLLPDEFLGSLSVERREQSWHSQLEMLHDDHRPWIAECGGRVVGFVSAGANRDDDAGPMTGEVYAIYVDPECWSRGIGGNLMEHARRDLRRHGYRDATLWVLGSNRQAREFYEGRDWVTDGAVRTESIGGRDVEEVRYRLSPV